MFADKNHGWFLNGGKKIERESRGRSRPIMYLGAWKNLTFAVSLFLLRIIAIIIYRMVYEPSYKFQRYIFTAFIFTGKYLA